ncbi:MAG: peptidoglycan DD-metalloendopeptidase family protein [Bacillota bacterium]
MNFKKLFPDKNVSQKKLLDFLDKKGFYIVLALCITIIGVTAALLATNNITSSNSYSGEDIISPDMAGNISGEDSSSAYLPPEESDVESAAKAAAKTGTATGKPSAAVESPKPTAEPKKTDAPKGQSKEGTSKDSKTTSANVSKSSGAKSSDTGKSQKFIMPVFGEISFEYADDKLVYSKTLDEWRAHSGVDLRADRGTPVKVVADGVVTEIKNDPRLGVMIVVEHSNGIKTVYANLASGDMVTPNQKVKQGEVIGSVGNTASFESAEPAHLHFEVLKNNEPQDPGDYLPKSALNNKKD